MSNRFRNRIKGLCRIGLVLLFGFSLISLTACSVEDVAKDIIDEDVEFDADLELDELTVQSPAPAAALARALTIDDSGTVSVQDLLDDVGDLDYDIDLVDIDDIDLQYVDVSYSATWENGLVTQITCSLTIDGDLNTEGPVEITETIINSQTPTTLTSVTLSENAIPTINAYLASRSTPFTYTLTCTAPDEIGAVTVNYSANLGVTISGNI